MASTGGGGSSPGDKTVNRVALCSAIFAGFAYVGYTVVRNAICRRGRGRDDRGLLFTEDEEVVLTIRRFSVASQTDLLLGNLDCSSTIGILRPMSVQERIRELNLRARQFGDCSGVLCTPGCSPVLKPRSLQTSPWSSPRILSPVDIQHFLSRSAENLTITTMTPPASPRLRRKNTPKRGSYSHAVDLKAIESGNGLENTLSNGNQISEVHILLKDSEESLKKRLDGLYNKGRVITPYEAKSLVALLHTTDEDLLNRTLTTIANCAVFSVNQDFLREAGCLPMLKNVACSSKPTVQISAAKAIGNMAVNQENQRELKICIPILLKNLELPEASNSLKLSSLIALTNLAILPEWHSSYVYALHTLLNLLDSNEYILRLQASKLLVNLSCNREMVPHILAAQAPKTLLDLLDPSCKEDLLLRLTTLLMHLVMVVQHDGIDPTELPAEDKAASPETLYALLYGHNTSEKLCNKIFVLTSHKSDDIKANAKQIYPCLCSKS